MPGRVTPPPTKSDINDPSWTRWFSNMSTRFTAYSGSANPTVAQVPNGQWVIYKNTSLNEVRMWYNNDGTLVKSAAFT